MKMITITTCAALAALMLATSANAAAPATGCLKQNGQLIQFKLGDKPLRKCPRATKKVSLSVHESNQVTSFHEVIGIGQELIISDKAKGWDQWVIEGICSGSPKGRGVGMIVYHRHAAMSIVNNGETQVSGNAEGVLGASYNLPHNYELAAKTGTIDVISAKGDRIHVEATLVVNHVECILSGTAELFTR